MVLPSVEDEDVALRTIDLIRGDPRLQELQAWFGSVAGLAEAVDHLESLGTRDDAEAEQVAAITANWRRVASGSLTPPDVLATWDSRLGRERDSIPRSAELYPDRIAGLIYDLAQDWGLTGASEISGRFDVAMPIGGLVRANLARPATAAAMLDEGQVTARQVIGLAGRRDMTPGEKVLAAELAVEAETEEDALRCGLERAFGLQPDAWRDRSSALRSGTMRENDTGALPVLLASAPMVPGRDGSPTPRRPTTAEAWGWLLSTLEGEGSIPANASILQVTTSIYWIYNQIGVRTVIPRSMRLTTVGYRESLVPGQQAQQFLSQHYLQEMKATIEELPKLERWARGDD